MHEEVKGTKQNVSHSTFSQITPATMKNYTNSMASMQQNTRKEQTFPPTAATTLQRMVGNRQLGKIIQAMHNQSVKHPSSIPSEQNGSSQHDRNFQHAQSPQHYDATSNGIIVQRASVPNNTELPEQLKTGIEALSGMAMDDVKVHYNSAQPKQLDALAYAQGNDIHLGPGQEQHLPHEAWHVVQQRQGRVKPTLQLKGIDVNDNEQLEKEATVYGNRALRLSIGDAVAAQPATGSMPLAVAQLMLIKVKTKKGQTGRLISSVEFEGRVPTTAKGGQGDHTVADFLPKLMLEQMLCGLTHQEAGGIIGTVFNLVDEKTQTSFKNDDSKMVKLDFTEVNEQLQKYREMSEDTSMEGEDLNSTLENLLDAYLRLWNKRTGAAYSREDGKTDGGGGGMKEKEAKKQIMMLGERARDIGGDEEIAMDTVPSLLDSIDFLVSPGTIKEASDHISMALELMLHSYPELEYNGSDVMYKLVGAYSEKMNLKEAEAQELFTYCYKSYYGESDDFDMNER
ncbi:eCIS core domain-containing protein [Paenibacillus endoradicis]|uniref:eCIS core domain-containing protein n=1 Tax=Paenibacillus endoradicis TaxID=2972487 RepID=UPI002158BB75|nr:DUF4157 domain-containing protein [Paenibacillus endoradicis]MCR8657693.1 DUF4157 domain-containing protein [Paenibacillus endoradicis]